MNQLANFGGGSLPANPADLATGLHNVGMAVQSTSINPILRLLKDGVFVYGQENIEVTEDSQWAVNPYSIEHGWACWGDGELLGEVMVPLNSTVPTLGELPDHGEPWSQQISMHLMCMSGEDKGVTVLYKSTSKGFLNMSKKLCNEIIVQVQSDPDHIVPLVELDMDHYQHKKYGKIYTPILDVVEWISIDTGEPDEVAEAAPEPEPEEKPKRSRKAKTEASDKEETAAESVTDDPAPRRRRRRRA